MSRSLATDACEQRKDYAQTERETDIDIPHRYIETYIIYAYNIFRYSILDIALSVAQQLYSPTRLCIWFIGDIVLSISDNNAIRVADKAL